ncbi:MAG: hypothetical protein PHU82_00305 [Candidatus Pacebacteria bacterium]|jgi:hypothetical protein|nr:hypothetical protein [Candidatus Paceibacterota bacterium]MDD4994418.1 hypothetical protein [Candidatus Paceibacterota bacterium]MDD5535174.1 hypothetical protein [Candidatus Paceibacterota bacterium]
MKNWARKFNPHKTAYRTPALFKIRKINKIKKTKARKTKKGN